MKIVVLDGHTLNPGDLSWTGLESLGEVAVYERSTGGTDEVIARIGDAPIILTNKTPLRADTLRQLPSLKYIGVLATGYDVVDVPTAISQGIAVTNIPTYGTDSVAQMVMAHLLGFCHHAAEHAAAVRSGDWTRSPDFCFWNYPMVELSGKTMGIVGFGRIGRRVGELAHALGMRVLAHDIYEAGPPEWPGFGFVGTEELLRESDVVSLNCPLTPENRGMINSKSLKQMKKSAFLINCSRGPLVVGEDLAQALHDGRIAGAGLDVLSTEPPSETNPLLSAPNCQITPHIAWATHEARARLLNTAVENLKAYLEGREENRVGM